MLEAMVRRVRGRGSREWERDFPWVWAVRNRWLQNDRRRYPIQVTEDLGYLTEMLFTPVGATRETLQAWAVFVNSSTGAAYAVEPVLRARPEACWAQHIQRLMWPEDCAGYVVLANSDESRGNVMIYRHPGGFEAMNALIDERAAQYRTLAVDHGDLGRRSGGFMD